MVNEFKVGDQVAHIHKGNGVIEGFEENSFGKMWPVLKLDNGCKWKSHPDHLRPRNFLSKIAEEQKCECGNPEPHEKWEPECNLGQSADHAVRAPDDPDLDSLRRNKTVSQQFNEVFKPERFQRNAYGQLVDTVTGLEADSDGLVQISSIRDSVRSIS